MKTMTFAAMLAALMSAPVLAQSEGDNHSGHHERAPSPAAQTATESACPMAMNGDQGTMQHMAQMQQMMQMMQQMQTQMQGMHDQMMRMQGQMQGRQRLPNHK